MSRKKEIVIQMTENFEKQNTEALLDFYTDDIVWNMIGNMILFGKEDVRKMMGNIRFDGEPDFKTGQIFEAGEKVVLINRVFAVMEDGKPFNRQWCNIYSFLGDKISYIESYPVDLTYDYITTAKEKDLLL